MNLPSLKITQRWYSGTIRSAIARTNVAKKSVRMIGRKTIRVFKFFLPEYAAY